MWKKYCNYMIEMLENQIKVLKEVDTSELDKLARVFGYKSYINGMVNQKEKYKLLSEGKLPLRAFIKGSFPQIHRIRRINIKRFKDQYFKMISETFYRL